MKKILHPTIISLIIISIAYSFYLNIQTNTKIDNQAKYLNAKISISSSKNEASSDVITSKILSVPEIIILKNYIKQLEKAIFITPHETQNYVTQISTQVSIWIGVIGFIAIFLPLIINIDLKKETEELKAENKKISSMSMRVEEDIKNTSDSIRTFESVIVKQNLQLQQIASTSTTIMTEFQITKVKINLMDCSIKINQLEPIFLLTSFEDPIKTISYILDGICDQLNIHKDLEDISLPYITLALLIKLEGLIKTTLTTKRNLLDILSHYSSELKNNSATTNIETIHDIIKKLSTDLKEIP